jgi:hypothetical protein
MPIQSQAQQRLMYAAASKPGGVGGVPQSVGQDFVSAGPAGGSFKSLPKKKMGPKMSRAHAEGRISSKAAAKAGY